MASHLVGPLKRSSGLCRAGFERRIQFAFDAKFHLIKLVADIWSMGPGPVDRVIGKAWDDVPVAMVDGLAGGLAIVDDHIEPVGTRRGPDCAAQTRQKRADGSGHRIGNLAQLSVMRPGHHQGMAAIDRIDVKKRYCLSRLEHFGRGDRAVGDLAEYAVRIVWSMAHDTTLPRRKQACFWNRVRNLSILSRFKTSTLRDEALQTDFSQAPRDEPTTAGLAGALIVSFSPRRAITAIAEASPCRTFASL
jgi:hypothetical protein